MDFFAKQDKARRTTALLIIYFFLAIVGMVAILNLAIYLGIQHGTDAAYTPYTWLTGPFWLVTLLIVGVVVAGTGWRLLQLNKGGESLARMLGGQPVAPQTRLPGERMLINVTEEMAIAAGVPVPRLFIIPHEQGINAFVAGYGLDDMALAVTQGALDNLTRDELQGVIGHEFSHIYNADTRLNIQIVSVLAGILLLGEIGRFLCRSATRRNAFRSRRDDRGTIAVLGAGVVLFVVGYTGLFFGRLIQAAISRQRELLADASSVQFTRNPEGIGSALFRIGYADQSSYLDTTSQAQEVNHMCFGETLALSRWLASHPPIAERIAAIDPQLMPRLRSRYNAQRLQQREQDRASVDSPAQVSGFQGGSPAGASIQATPSTSPSVTDAAAPATSVPSANLSRNLIGTASQASQDWAQETLRSIQSSFGDRLSRADLCELTLYAMVLKETGLTALNTSLCHSNGQQIQDHPELCDCEEALNGLDKVRWPALLEIVTARLKSAEQSTREHVVQTLRELVRADQRTTFGEFVVLSFVGKHLRQEKSGRQRIKRHGEAATEIATLLSMFAFLGSRDKTGNTIRAPESLFREMAKAWFPLLTLEYSASVNANALETALLTLSRLSPLLKPAVIDVCAACISADGHVSAKEYQLLRLVVELLDCPMPPVIPGQISS